MRRFPERAFDLHDERECMVQSGDMDADKMFLAIGDDGKHAFELSFADVEKIHAAMSAWLNFEEALVPCPNCGGHRCQYCDGEGVTRSTAREIERFVEERRVG